VRTELGITGKAIGIAADGALLVEVEDRVEEIRAGGVIAVGGKPSRGNMNRRGGA